GELLPPSPPAEKATAAQDRNHSGQASTDDRGGNGVGAMGGNERDVGAGDYAVSADGEALGHRIEAAAGVGPNSLVKGRVESVKQMARQRNGGSEDAVCRIEEGIHLHCPTSGKQVLPNDDSNACVPKGRLAPRLPVGSIERAISYSCMASRQRMPAPCVSPLDECASAESGCSKRPASRKAMAAAVISLIWWSVRPRM